MSHYDVVVIGAGPAGAIASLVLARSGLSVAMVDGNASQQRSASSQFKIGESLSAAAMPLLRELGLSSLLDHGQHQIARGNSSAWGSSELAHQDFIQDPRGHGWHLHRAVFDADLRQAAVDSGVISYPYMVKDLIRSEPAAGQRRRSHHLWDITTTHLPLSAGAIIDASGRSSNVARLLGLKRQKDDTLTAVYRWFAASDDDRSERTLVEASRQGWWYSVQVPMGGRIVSFQTDADVAEQLRNDPQLWEELAKQTSHMAHFIKTPHPLHKYGALRFADASGGQLPQFYGEGWLATGDAAISFDPLSSQGIFNSLYTGMKAAQSLIECLQGDEMAMVEYASGLRRIRQVYLNHHRLMYFAEQRWPQSPFWQKRNTASATMPTTVKQRPTAAGAEETPVKA